MLFLAIEPEDIRPESIQILETRANTNPAMKGVFSKLIYSTDYLTMNSLYVAFSLEPTMFFKNTVQFRMTSENQNAMRKLVFVEQMALRHYDALHGRGKKGDESVSQIERLFHSGAITVQGSVQPDRVLRMLMKVLGVWQNGADRGLYLKFIVVDKDLVRSSLITSMRYMDV